MLLALDQNNPRPVADFGSETRPRHPGPDDRDIGRDDCSVHGPRLGFGKGRRLACLTMNVQLPDIFGIMLAVLLLMAAWTDIKTRTISNELNATIALLAIGFWWVAGESLWPDVSLRIAVALGLFAIFALLFVLKMMGGGDVKMIAALALWLPFNALMVMLTVMALAGGVITVALLIRARWRPNAARPEVPYGVAIAIGGLWVIANGLLTTSVA
ncbi:MAG: prepilin peptidase [Rhizorhabdus sp.]